MSSDKYHICDGFLYTLSKLNLHEKKTVYATTHLNAWWADNKRKASRTDVVYKFVYVLFHLDGSTDESSYTTLLINLKQYWGVW